MVGCLNFFFPSLSVRGLHLIFLFFLPPFFPLKYSKNLISYIITSDNQSTMNSSHPFYILQLAITLDRVDGVAADDLYDALSMRLFVNERDLLSQTESIEYPDDGDQVKKY